jgi:hypothetical protein
MIQAILHLLDFWLLLLDRASKTQDVSDKHQRVQAFKKMITISNVHLKCGLFLSLDAIVSNAKDMFLEISSTIGEDGAVHVPYGGYRHDHSSRRKH